MFRSISRHAITLLLTYCAVGRLGAQEKDSLVMLVDLAVAPAHDTSTVSPARYVVRVINRLPTRQYSVRVAVSGRLPLPKLNQDTGFVFTSAACSAVATQHQALKAATDEKEVPGLITKLQTAMSETGECPEAQQTIAATRWIDTVMYSLEAGRRMTVTVNRLDDQNRPEETWQLVNLTEQDRRWDVTYGYTFGALRGVPGFADQHTYIAKALGDSGKFQIVEDGSGDHWTSVPTVFYSYVVPHSSWRKVFPGITSGLAVDLEKIAVMLGFNWVIGDNLHLAFGGMIHREDVLKRGLYPVGDTVSTQLDAAAVHEQDLRVRPFVSISWRFAKNPFGAPKTDAPEAKKEEPKKEKSTEEKPSGSGG